MTEPEEVFADSTSHERAVFAAGCFWCIEPAFDKVDGVLKTTVGYTGGHTDNPTYKQIGTGATGHVEAIEVVFDPQKVTYESLLEVFWNNVDPTTPNRQFCDVGSQYRPEIFVKDKEQRSAAENSKATREKTKTFSAPIIVPITDASKFYPAEEYHQDYYKKNPDHYKRYRRGCGRDVRLKQLWGEKGGL